MNGVNQACAVLSIVYVVRDPYSQLSGQTKDKFKPLMGCRETWSASVENEKFEKCGGENEECDK